MTITMITTATTAARMNRTSTTTMGTISDPLESVVLEGEESDVEPEGDEGVVGHSVQLTTHSIDNHTHSDENTVLNVLT